MICPRNPATQLWCKNGKIPSAGRIVLDFPPVSKYIARDAETGQRGPLDFKVQKNGKGKV